LLGGFVGGLGAERGQEVREEWSVGGHGLGWRYGERVNAGLAGLRGSLINRYVG
jgi:hypothetical protein